MKKYMLCFVFLFMLSHPVFAFSKQDCLRFYQDRNYSEAVKCYESILDYDSRDFQPHFYYAASLFYDKQYKKSYEEYSFIARRYKNTEVGDYAAKEAQKVYDKMQSIKKAKKNDRGDYSELLDETSIWRYQPIKVWIQPSPYAYITYLAFMEWQVQSSELITFSMLKSPENAQIKVYFVDKLDHSNGGDELGLTRLKYRGRYNDSAIIQILRKASSGAMLSTKQVYPVVLHEVGHSLGISGHSDSVNDIMFPQDSVNFLKISNRDLNTLRTLYGATPRK